MLCGVCYALTKDDFFEEIKELFYFPLVEIYYSQFLETRHR